MSESLNLNGTQTNRLPCTEPAKSNTPKSKRLRGFAAMTPEQQRQIASRGGLAAHRNGNAHKWTPEEAREAAAKRHRGSSASQLDT